MNYMLRFGLWPAAFAFCICAETLPPETERQLAREIYKELIEIKSGFTTGATTPVVQRWLPA